MKLRVVHSEWGKQQPLLTVDEETAYAHFSQNALLTADNQPACGQ